MMTGTKKPARDDVVLRVQRSLRRHGLDGVAAVQMRERTIQLDGSVSDPDDCPMAVAVARTVPGVGSVICKIQLQN